MIGRALYPELLEQQFEVICAGRHMMLEGCLKNVDLVIHLAGVAHGTGPFFDVNYHGTRNLALKAARSGVKRFVFLSSVTVNGRSGAQARAITEKDIETPYNAYSLSKYKAEQALRLIEKETGMQVVIIRPPLVYGPGVKANFLKLLGLAATGLPLPLGRIPNQRSFIGIDNLNHAVITCALHPCAAGHTFFVSDGCSLSTPRLMENLSAAMGKKPRLFYFPARMFRWVLTLLGKQGIYERLWWNLTVDISKIKHLLGWEPRVSVEEGIKKTVQWYLNKK